MAPTRCKEQRGMATPRGGVQGRLMAQQSSAHLGSIRGPQLRRVVQWPGADASGTPGSWLSLTKIDLAWQNLGTRHPQVLEIFSQLESFTEFFFEWLLVLRQN